MPISKGAVLSKKDIFIDYPYEEVMFRRMHQDGLIYRKFYGDLETAEPIEHTNKLFNDALLLGEEITKEQYLAGK